MEPREFYDYIRHAKELSGKSNVELIIATGKSEGTLKGMWSGRYDGALSGYFAFLNAIGYAFEISSDLETYTIETIAELQRWLSAMMKAEDKNYTALGEMLGISRMTAKRIIEKGDLKLSIFLRFLNIKKLRLDIVPVGISD